MMNEYMLEYLLFIATPLTILLTIYADVYGERRLGYGSLAYFSLSLIIASLFINDGSYTVCIPGLKIYFYMDALSRVFLLLTGLTGLMASIYASSIHGGDGSVLAYYTPLALSFITSAYLVSVDNWLFFIVLWEIIGFIVFYNAMVNRIGGVGAQYTYYVVIHLSGLLVVLGLGYLYIHGIRHVSQYIPPLYSTAVLLAAIGMLAKTGCFPYHFWVQKLYEDTDPLYVSAISGLIDLLGVYGVTRLIYGLQGVGEPMVYYVLFTASLASIYASALWYWGCRDIRSVLAWSSIYNAGWMIAGVSIAGLTGYRIHGFLPVYVLGYGLAKAASFLVVKSGGLEYRSYRSVSPIIAFLFALSLLGIEGVPPSGVFIARIDILRILYAYSPFISLALIPAWISSSIFFYRLFADTMFPTTGETVETRYRLSIHVVLTSVFLFISLTSYAVLMVIGGVRSWW